MYHQLFVKLTSTYTDYMMVYTDESLFQESNGCAFMYEDQVSNTISVALIM
jgi:hypothetical protein